MLIKPQAGSQAEIPGLDPVAAFAAIIGLISCLAFSLVTLRPNRLAAGQDLHLLELGIEALKIFLVWVLLLLTSSVLPRLRYWAQTILGLTCLFLLLALASAQLDHPALAAHPYARISLGPALWVSLFAVFMLITNAWRRLHQAWARFWIVLCTTCFVLLAGVGGGLENLSIFQEYAQHRDRFWAETLQHIFIAGASSAGAVALGIPLGLLAYVKDRASGRLFFFLNMVQTVPSLALFGLLVAPLALLARKVPFLQEAGIQGIGWTPAVLALTLYCLLPIVRNTYAGFKSVDQDTLQAGRGMGMTGAQLLYKVQLPVVSPLALGGIRVAIIQAVGNTAVAALIGAGGLGVFIFQGLGQAAAELILLGALPTILLALFCDGLFRAGIAALTPKGLRGR